MASIERALSPGRERFRARADSGAATGAPAQPATASSSFGSAAAAVERVGSGFHSLRTSIEAVASEVASVVSVAVSAPQDYENASYVPYVPPEESDEADRRRRRASAGEKLAGAVERRMGVSVPPDERSYETYAATASSSTRGPVAPLHTPPVSPHASPATSRAEHYPPQARAAATAAAGEQVAVMAAPLSSSLDRLLGEPDGERDDATVASVEARVAELPRVMRLRRRELEELEERCASLGAERVALEREGDEAAAALAVSQEWLGALEARSEGRASRASSLDGGSCSGTEGGVASPGTEAEVEEDAVTARLIAEACVERDRAVLAQRRAEQKLRELGRERDAALARRDVAAERLHVAMQQTRAAMEAMVRLHDEQHAPGSHMHACGSPHDAGRRTPPPHHRGPRPARRSQTGPCSRSLSTLRQPSRSALTPCSAVDALTCRHRRERDESAVASAAARVELARLREELRVETEARETLEQQAAASGAGAGTGAGAATGVGCGGGGRGGSGGGVGGSGSARPELSWVGRVPSEGQPPPSPPRRSLHAHAPAPPPPRAMATKGEGRRAARGNPSPRRAVAGVDDVDA